MIIYIYNFVGGAGSGGAMVLGKPPVPGRPTIRKKVYILSDTQRIHVSVF